MENTNNLVKIAANATVELLKEAYEKNPFADFVEFKVFGTQDFMMIWKTRIAVFAIDTFLDPALRDPDDSSSTSGSFGPEHRLIDMMVSICASDGLIQNQFLGWVPTVFQEHPFLSNEKIKGLIEEPFPFHGMQFIERQFNLVEKLKVWNLMIQQSYQPSYFYCVKIIAEKEKK